MWKQTNYIKHHHYKVAIVGNKNYTTALIGKHIYGLDHHNGEILWDCPNGTHFTAYESGVCIGDIAIWPHHPGGAKNKLVLRGFNIADGTILWEHEKEYPHYGCGLLTNGQWLIYSDYLSDIQHLIYADPATGQPVHTFSIKGMHIRAGSVSQVGPSYGAVADNQVYFNHRKEARLYRAPITKEATALIRVPDIDHDVLMLDSIGNNVLVVVAEGKDESGQLKRAVLRVEAATGKVVQRIPYPYLSELNRINALASPQNNGLLALHFSNGGQGQGLMLVDFDREDVRWHIGIEDEWYVTDVALTPYDIVACIFKSKASEDPYWVRLDIESGEQLPFPEIEGKPGNNIYWNGKQLILDNSRGWAILEWDELAEPEIKPTPELIIEPASIQDEATPLEKAQAGVLVRVDPETPPSEADLLLSQVVTAFLECMTAQEDADLFDTKVKVFQKQAKQLFETYPHLGSETIVAGLVQMGVPLNVAQQDVLALLVRK